MQRPKHCHGHNTGLIQPKITNKDLQLNYLRQGGVMCPKKKCGEYNFPDRRKCHKCGQRLQPSNSMKKQGRIYLVGTKWKTYEELNNG